MAYETVYSYTNFKFENAQCANDNNNNYYCTYPMGEVGNSDCTRNNRQWKITAFATKFSKL